MPNISDLPFGLGVPSIQIVSGSLGNNSTAGAGQLSGAGIVLFSNTGGTPGNFTTRTAALTFADSNLYIGYAYFLLLCNNQGTGTLTLVGGSNVTVSGTAGVLPNTSRIFSVTCGGTSAVPTMTFTGLALSFSSAV